MEIDSSIIQWAEERGLFSSPNPYGQAEKTVEEALEVLRATHTGNFKELIDGIGDVYITLVILASMNGLTVDKCVKVAYNEIKNRTGITEGGVFIKDSQ